LGWVVCLPLKQIFNLFYFSRLALGRQPAAHPREDHLAGGHRHGQRKLGLPMV
jgi:hypothetical protein